MEGYMLEGKRGWGPWKRIDHRLWTVGEEAQMGKRTLDAFKMEK